MKSPIIILAAVILSGCTVAVDDKLSAQIYTSGRQIEAMAEQVRALRMQIATQQHDLTEMNSELSSLRLAIVLSKCH